MSDELITWLRAQLDEDEGTAHEAATAVADRVYAPASVDEDPRYAEVVGHWRADRWLFLGRVTAQPAEDDVRPLVAAEIPERVAEHIARHDPASVLADIAAKRAILTALEEPTTAANVEEEEGLIRAVRLLAFAYADRPGYREEWRP